MPTVEFVQMMARYNAWQNDNLMGAADALDEAARQQNRGAFFGSITATFSHLLWGDMIWMARFTGSEAPQGGIAASTSLAEDWAGFKAARRQMDARLLDWAQTVPVDWLVGDLSWYSGATGRQVCKPKTLLVVHLFNHQTHHRGQIHAMLTAAGARPGDTDLCFMPPAGEGA